MSPAKEIQHRWWEAVELGLDGSVQWCIGPLCLRVFRSRRELRVAFRRGEDALDETLSREQPAPKLSPEEEEAFDVRRFAHTSGDQIRLRPRTPDRPLVVKPAHPFGLPPEEQVTLFVSSALWIDLLNPAEVTLLTEAAYRPSDTWFGANTRVGELCYASRTSAHLDLETLPLRPHRATTAVTIHNRSRELLWLERLKLPLTNLSVFASQEGRIWTEALDLRHQRPGAPAEASIGKGPPAGAGRTQRLADPPVAITRGFLVDAFGGLFSRKEKEEDERADRKPGTPGAADS